ncbi:MAG: Hpt domain-containing protein [Rhodopseudomonas palustris]|uniref:Hpt domain-containing protein n=1 Tax=Rhodopseudomonas palustris TaxID=1076 RepID=A0A933VTU6_RHOPL|nr:Hpt domain-containing protein [Rhodopseudomonas palustris]
MVSPPLVPDFEVIDEAHLERMTLGDKSLEREVLALFAAQSASLVAMLSTWPADAAALAHTLKGSARAIGAFAVADAAAEFEDALRCGTDAAEPLAALDAAVDHARVAIDERLER